MYVYLPDFAVERLGVRAGEFLTVYTIDNRIVVQRG